MLELRFFLKSLLLPPALQLLLLLLAWWLWRRHRLLARVCLVTSVLSLWLLSTPLVASWMARAIEPEALPATELPWVRADAIVVLGATVRSNSAEFGTMVSSRHGVERLRYAAFLQQRTKLPILLSGGTLDPAWERSLADVMQEELETIYGVPARWIETNSRTTAENARFSYILLSEDLKTRIVLVTHAAHMRRARLLFEQAGFEVIPAPTAFYGTRFSFPDSLVPAANALNVSSELIHETLGYYYYRWLGLFDA